MLLSLSSIISSSSKSAINKGRELFDAANKNTSLVYTLLCNHQDMMRMCIEIRSAINKSNFRQTIHLVTKLEKINYQHILLENEKLYPRIIENMTNRNAPYIRSCQLWSTSTKIELRRFAKKWQKPVDAKNQTEEIVENWDEFDNVLHSLMEAKEIELYPLYNRSLENCA